MLTVHTCVAGKSAAVSDLAVSGLPADVVWIDVMNGDAAEVAFVERATGLHVPTLRELSEIESSSRLRVQKEALYLSAPMIFGAAAGEPRTTSVGFVLTQHLLITIRFADLKAFETFTEGVAKPGTVHHSGAGTFAGLLEVIVDRIADGLESVGADLDAVSHRIFGAETTAMAMRRRPAREDADLRTILRKVGRAGDLTSKVRDSLLGFGRIVPYVLSHGADWLPPEVKPQLETMRHDIASLNDYDGHLTNNVQLLLDATLGLINIEQNNIIKVLTIVSVVGVPPTLVASMYGMNFRHMPELDWTWGYPYGLLLILLSAILPLLWFKLRGWL
jgi:magnesium transporter